jgi:hypothetical protein
MKYILYLLIIFHMFMFSSCDSFTLFPKDTAYDPGDTIWIHTMPGSDSLFIDNSLAIGTDGSIYYAASGGTVYWTPSRIMAINKDDGSLKWQSGILDHVAISSKIVVGDDGTIYVIGFYTLYAIDPNNGAFKWKWKVPETIPYNGGNVYTYGQIGALALTTDGNLILGSIGAGTYYRGLYLVTSSGSLKWVNLDAVGSAIYGGISVGKDNTAFYYSEINLNGVVKPCLVAVNIATGGIKWTTEVVNKHLASSNIAIDIDGTLVCSFNIQPDSKVLIHKIEPSTGSIFWSSTDEEAAPLNLINTSGQLFEFGSGGYTQYNAEGKITQHIIGGFGAIDQLNRIVGASVISSQYKLCWYNSDGNLESSVNMDGILGDEILISSEEVVYAIINSNSTSRIPVKISAIQSDAQLAVNGWPRPAHDNRNTSNMNKH